VARSAVAAREGISAAEGILLALTWPALCFALAATPAAAEALAPSSALIGGGAAATHGLDLFFSLSLTLWISHAADAATHPLRRRQPLSALTGSLLQLGGIALLLASATAALGPPTAWEQVTDATDASDLRTRYLAETCAAARTWCPRFVAANAAALLLKRGGTARTAVGTADEKR